MAGAKRGARAVGVDIDPDRIKEATEKVRAAGVQDRVTLIRGDIFDPQIKIGDASVVTLYLLQSLNEKLKPRLKGELAKGSRVVSHAFSMGADWPPEISFNRSHPPRASVENCTDCLLWPRTPMDGSA